MAPARLLDQGVAEASEGKLAKILTSISAWRIRVMLDDRSDPINLRIGIEKITQQWFAHRGPWLGISEDKLSQTRLPDPLKWIYQFAGEWPSDNWWETVYAYQGESSSQNQELRVQLDIIAELLRNGS